MSFHYFFECRECWVAAFSPLFPTMISKDIFKVLETRNYLIQEKVQFCGQIAGKISSVNCLTNDKISDLSKFKAFADDKINVTQKFKFELGRVENIVGKEENAGISIFPFSHNVFKSCASKGR